MDTIFAEILPMIDLIYILTCNAATYVVLSVYESINGKKSMKVWEKRLAATLTAILIGVLFISIFNHNTEAVIIGFFLQFLCYDYFLKPLIRRVQGKISED